MTPRIAIGGTVTAVALSGALALLAAGPAYAADYDLGHLPATASDAKTLASSLWFRRSTSTVGGYCLYAYNSDASSATGSDYMTYLSIEGGLQFALSSDRNHCE